jgi:hypothetical protein
MATRRGRPSFSTAVATTRASIGPRCTGSWGARRCGSSTRASGLHATSEPGIRGML